MIVTDGMLESALAAKSQQSTHKRELLLNAIFVHEARCSSTTKHWNIHSIILYPLDLEKQHWHLQAADRIAASFTSTGEQIGRTTKYWQLAVFYLTQNHNVLYHISSHFFFKSLFAKSQVWHLQLVNLKALNKDLFNHLYPIFFG